MSPSSPALSVPPRPDFHLPIPEMLGRLPLPSEVWASGRERLPEPVRHAWTRAQRAWKRLPPMPRLDGWRLFAAAVPAGLALGLIGAWAVDPEIMLRGGKPFIEVAHDGVRVEPWRVADLSYPEDAAPWGYPEGSMADAGPLASSIAEAGEYAEAVDGAVERIPTASVTDGQVLGESYQGVPLVSIAPAGPPDSVSITVVQP